MCSIHPAHRSFFAHAFMLAPIGIAIASVHGEWTAVNPALCGMLGYDGKELCSFDYRTVAFQEDLPSAERQIQEVLEERRAFCSVEMRYRHKSGRTVWVSQHISAMQGEDGQPQSLYCYFTDITEQRQSNPLKTLAASRDLSGRIQAGQTLSGSQGNLAEAQKIASIGSWEWDVRSSEVIWSKEMLHIFDIPPESFVGDFEYVMQYIHSDDRAWVRDSISRAMEGQPFSLECRIVTPSGLEKQVHIQGIVIFDKDRKPCKMHGTVQDISDRYKLQQMLEETIDRYTSLKKYNPDGIISLDKQGFVISSNPAVQTISGYTAQELVQLHFTELLHPDDQDSTDAWYVQLLQGKMNKREELRIRHKNGAYIHLLLTPAPIVIRQQLAGCYIMLKDITEQKKTDELLRQSEKLSVVGQLAAGVAHEIRNPLTALKGFVKLMMHSEHSTPKYLAIMKEELERIELIVSELLMLSKPQTSLLRCLNLKEVLEEVQALIGTQAIMKNIDIVLEAQSDDYPVHCEPNQIKQVFINFIKNAIEAMQQEGTIRIHIGIDSRSRTRVRVIDQGCGIPEDKLPRVGEPFFTTKEGGTGLGLMISQKIVEHHGGTMSITSEVNVGTTVEVSFPSADAGSPS